jgi:hypothetical protein
VWKQWSLSCAGEAHGMNAVVAEEDLGDCVLHGVQACQRVLTRMHA